MTTITSMDHLPLPPNASDIDLRVPDLCGPEPYDGGTFRTFPMRCGWIHPDHSTTSDGFFVEYEMRYPSQDPELEKLLQRWSFFGLLHQVLGDEHYSATDYRGCDEKGPYIHTRKLTATLAKWTSEKDDWTQEQKRNLFQVLAQHCSLAMHSLGVLAPHFHHGDFNKTIRQSLAALGELLTSSLDQLIGSVESPASWRSRYWREDTKRDMLHNGWCENQIATALGQFKSLSAAHYLRLMTALSQPGVHGNCTENECHVLSVIPSNYEPEHVGQCQCDLVGPRPEDVYDALLSDRIPFIRIRGSTLDDVSLEVVKKQLSERPAYVALSHV